MKKVIFLILILMGPAFVMAQESFTTADAIEQQEDDLKKELDRFFDDQLLIERFAEKIQQENLDNLLLMIDDKNLYHYKIAAAVRVFRHQYAKDIVQKDKAYIEKSLLRRLEVSKSKFLEIEIIHTLLLMDRYRFFSDMISLLVKSLDHYDLSVVGLSYRALNEVVILEKPARVREARIVFNLLRKMFFLSRKKLAHLTETDLRLKHKLSLLRWAIKVLGTQELKNLPKEVISLM